MTPEQTIKIALWQAFYMGVRATIVARDEKLSNDAVFTALQKLDAITRGEETIYDPGTDAALYGGPGPGYTDRMQLMMREDRMLGEEISEGFYLLVEQNSRPEK